MSANLNRNVRPMRSRTAPQTRPTSEPTTNDTDVPGSLESDEKPKNVVKAASVSSRRAEARTIPKPRPKSNLRGMSCSTLSDSLSLLGVRRRCRRFVLTPHRSVTTVYRFNFSGICRVTLILPDKSTIVKDCATSSTLEDIRAYLREHLCSRVTDFHRPDVELAVQVLAFTHDLP